MLPINKIKLWGNNESEYLVKKIMTKGEKDFV